MSGFGGVWHLIDSQDWIWIGGMNYSRRQLIQMSGLLAGFLAATAAKPLRAQTASEQVLPANLKTNSSKTIAVIGAGLAGLTAAYRAAQAGHRVHVFETASHYGGRSLTLRPQDIAYKEWWFKKYNPEKHFPRMYVSSFAERQDSPGKGAQACHFHVPSWEGFDDPEELYLNAGPGRIPSHHTHLLDLCRELGVDLEPYIFKSDSNLLSDSSFRSGRPIQWREVHYSLIGRIAEIVYQAYKDGVVLQGYENVPSMLKALGNLDEKFKFKGSSTVGYVRAPGGWQDPSRLRAPLGLEEILASDLSAASDGSTQSMESHQDYIDWQPTLLQPVGGMDRIWQALLLREVSHGAQVDGFAKAVSGSGKSQLLLGDLVDLNSSVTGVFSQGDSCLVKVDGKSYRFDACIVTVAPPLLGKANRVRTADGDFVFPKSLLIDNNIDEGARKAFSEVKMTPACKVGFQATSRFWEEENQIYGGISWTTELSSQLWYPSSGFHSSTGILTGLYNRHRDAIVTSNKNISQRVEIALKGCESLHPGFKSKIYGDFAPAIAWGYMPGQVGGWADETSELQCDIYLKITNPSIESMYFAGDSYSQTPGWQEGAVRSAELAVKAISHGLKPNDPALYGSDGVMKC